MEVVYVQCCIGIQCWCSIEAVLDLFHVVCYCSAAQIAFAKCCVIMQCWCSIVSTLDSLSYSVLYKTNQAPAFLLG